MGNQGTTLRSDVLKDLKNTTAFSAEEIREYYKNFLQRCPEHSMSMDKETFAEYYKEVFPENDAVAFSDYIFRVFDADGNGSLDFKEFILALSINRNGTVEEKLLWLFNMVDLDGSKCISRDELKGLIESLNNLQREPASRSADDLADDIFKQADQDNSNTLCLNEFIMSAVTVPEMEKLLSGTVLAVSAPIQRTQVDSKKTC